MKIMDNITNWLIKVLAAALLVFTGFGMGALYGDGHKELLLDVKEVDRDIRSVVGDFDHYYDRARVVLGRSNSLSHKHTRDVTSAYDRFRGHLRDYKPDSVAWGHKAALKHHDVDLKSVSELERFVDYADDVLRDLKREGRHMKELAERLENSYANRSSHTKYYKTYHYYRPYYRPYYYRHHYYRPHYRHHYYYNKPYYFYRHGYHHGKHRGYGGIGFHFRIK